MKIGCYQTYKSSEIEWFGNMPKHWLSVRIKDVIKDINQGWSPNAENRTVEEGEWGVLKLSAVSNGKYSEKDHKALSGSTGLKHQYVVKKGDLLLTRSNTPELVGNCCLVIVQPKLILMYSDLIYCLNIKSQKILDRYLNYFLSSAFFRRIKTVSARGLNASMVKISQSIIRRWDVFKPPYIEQTAIADYLDTKTAQIDRKIGLLSQKRIKYGNLKQSLIKETVVRGLDNTVPMKDSGVDWIGEVPAHWEVRRLKGLIYFKKGKTPKSLSDDSRFPPYLSMDFLRGKDRQVIYVAPQEKLVMVVDNEPLILWDGANAGEVMLAKNGYLSSTMAVIKTKKKSFDNAFFFHFLKSLEKQFKDLSNGTTIPHFSPNVLTVGSFGIPPLQEQATIANYLNDKTLHIDRIIININTQIDRIKELRKTLINDVVTGKIKVVKEGQAA